MFRKDVLSIAWWNTSLSPRAQPRKAKAGKASDARSQTQRERTWARAERVVRALVDDLHVDVLALGEVMGDDVSRLQRACSAPLQSISHHDAEPRVADIGLLFRPAKVDRIDHEFRFCDVFGRKLSIALAVQFGLDVATPPLHLHVAHWSSHLREEGGKLRANVSFAATNALRNLLPAGAGERPYVVLMGDLNAEPFDQELTNSLGSTRDRELTKRRPGLMYNPFWRRLGERQTIESEALAGRRRGAGTHFYRSELTDRWRTFDQFLVSPSLLGGEGWVLCEDEVDVWQEPPLLGDRGHPVEPFDHFPIIGAFRREAPAEAR